MKDQTNISIDLPPVLTPEDIAELTRLKTRTITNACQRGQLRARKLFNSYWRVERSDFIAWWDGNLNTPANATSGKRPRSLAQMANA